MAVIDAPAVAWPLPTTFRPRDYQVDGLRKALHGNIVYDVGLGGGKSTMSLAALEALGAKRVLVLCPAKVIAVWRDEVAENAARQWVTFTGTVQGARGPLKNPSVARRCEAIIQADADARRIGRPFMAVVNYEATCQKTMANLLLGTPWDALICDESHKLAGAGAKTSILTKKVGERVRGRGGRIILCTGTFMPHSALSVYGQMRTLDTTALGTSWAAFKARYAKWRVLRERNICPVCCRAHDRPVGTGCPILCIDRTTGEYAKLVKGEPIYHVTPGGEKIPDGVDPEREAELMGRIAPWVHRVSQAELDAQTGLVEAVPQLRTIALDAETRRMYDALEKDLIAQYADGTITSANAMTNFGTLLRVANGHGRDAGTGEMRGLHLDRNGLCAKARLLLDELADEDPREPIVVFANWVFDFAQIERVCEKLGRRYGELSGRRTDGLDGKYMAPHIDLLAVQWQAGSEGLNFTRARHEIDYSLSTVSTPNTQAPRRLNRQGQTRHVTRRILAIEDSVEVNWFYALKRRTDQNDAILSRLKRGAS